mmetsp:Transcript_57974/g.141651  ORF Transcript_57974/g.141651 Transcript_57974/m.141651 type:complete len:102 (-) Transcript_57974:1999-2304(-)
MIRRRRTTRGTATMTKRAKAKAATASGNASAANSASGDAGQSQAQAPRHLEPDGSPVPQSPPSLLVPLDPLSRRCTTILCSSSSVPVGKECLTHCPLLLLQ